MELPKEKSRLCICSQTLDTRSVSLLASLLWMWLKTCVRVVVDSSASLSLMRWLILSLKSNSGLEFLVLLFWMMLIDERESVNSVMLCDMGALLSTNSIASISASRLLCDILVRRQVLWEEVGEKATPQAVLGLPFTLQ